MVTFEVVFTVDLAGLKDLINRLPDDAAFSVQSIGGEGTAADQIHAMHPPKARATKPSKVEAALLEALRDGPRGSAELSAALVDAGLAKGSVSRLTEMKRAGKVATTEDGKWEIAA